MVSVRGTPDTYCDGSHSLVRCLRGKEAAGFDFGEAFFQGEKLGNFPPLSSVTEIGQVEPLVSGVLKSGELRLEEVCKGAGSGRTIAGAEVKEGASPASMKVHQVVQLGFPRRRLDIARLQGRIDQRMGAALDFVLEVGRHGLFRSSKGPRRIIDPSPARGSSGTGHGGYPPSFPSTAEWVARHWSGSSLASRLWG